VRVNAIITSECSRKEEEKNVFSGTLNTGTFDVTASADICENSHSCIE
jgi:hypothetical protein